MPKFSKEINTRTESNTDNQTSSEMEQENESEIHSHSSHPNNTDNNNNNIPELKIDNIENEIIVDCSDSTYYPEKYKKCFLPQNDLAKEITLNTLRIMLIKIKTKAKKEEKIRLSDEIYVVNKSWYEKWKAYRDAYIEWESQQKNKND